MTEKGKRFVLLLDPEMATARQAALDIAGDEGALLIAHSVEAALNFAKRYKPTYALVSESRSHHEGKFLPALILEFSPETEVVILSEDSGALKSAAASASG
jgi:ActR/RegA family two-component response regulator